MGKKHPSLTVNILSTEISLLQNRKCSHRLIVRTLQQSTTTINIPQRTFRVSRLLELVTHFFESIVSSQILINNQ
jgi:hypothetical protein